MARVANIEKQLNLGGKAAAAKDFVAEKAGAAQDGITKMAGTAKSKVFGPEEDGGFDLGTKAKEVWDKTKTTADPRSRTWRP